jgi:hypothetical protein
MGDARSETSCKALVVAARARGQGCRRAGCGDLKGVAEGVGAPRGGAAGASATWLPTFSTVSGTWWWMPSTDDDAPCGPVTDP